MQAQKPELSIVIPLLNERDSITALITDLLGQRGIALEIILVDGGSNDGSYEQCRQLMEQHPGLVHSLQSEAGRAVQMNRGADCAQAEDLLFLHADSHIKETTLLHQALSTIRHQRQQQPDRPLAGHFALRFVRSQPGHERAYFFYEAKTYLNRADTINGDQGLLLSRSFFIDLGKFDESLPYMEDARLANKIFAQGQWITLPGVIYTSARRFESEGLKQRQILNAFMCNFQHIGLHRFFSEAGTAYRAQDHTAPLQLRPFLKIIHRLMMNDGILPAARRWYHTGGYIAANAWQLAFAADCRKAQLTGKEPGACATKRLDFYDRWLAALVTSAPGHALTAVLTLLWFYSLFISNDALSETHGS